MKNSKIFIFFAISSLFYLGQMNAMSDDSKRAQQLQLIADNLKSKQIYDLSPTQILRGHANQVKKVIQLSENLIASCSTDQTIKIWDIKNGECISTLEEENRIDSIIFLDKDLIASCSFFTGSIKIWDISSASCVFTFACETVINGIIKIDNHRIASYGMDGAIIIWDYREGHLLKVIEKHESSINCVAIAEDYELLVSGTEDGFIATTNISSDSDYATYIIYDFEKESKPVAFHDELKIAINGQTFTTKAFVRMSITFLKYLGNNQIAVGCSNGIVKLLNLLSRETINLEGHDAYISSIVKLSSEKYNNHLLTSSFDKTMKVWDLANGKCINSFSFNSEILSLTDLGDNHIAISFRNKNVQVVDLNKDLCLSTLFGHSDIISSIIKLNDGSEKSIVTASWDATIRICRTMTTEEIISNYFNVENPIVVYSCLIFNDQILSNIKDIFLDLFRRDKTVKESVDKERLENWLSSIHLGIRPIIRAKLETD